MHWIDPACLPETKGTVDLFLINPRGDADGLLLKYGKEVHFPPHMSKAVLAALKPGDTVKVRGVSPRGVDMVAAVSVQAGDAPAIVDHGPPKHEGPKKGDDHKGDKKPKPEPHKPVDVEGVVKHVLHGPKGEKRGALLQDGTIRADAAARGRVAPRQTRPGPQARGARRQADERLGDRG
jgi:hypothetical protein